MSRLLNRRQLLANLTLGAPVLLTGRKAANPAMNVLFIASDDCNNTFGCYGHPVVKTRILTGWRRGVSDSTGPIASFRCVAQAGRPSSVECGPPQRRFGRTRSPCATRSRTSWGYRSCFVTTWDIAVSPPGAENKTAGEGRNVTPNVGEGSAMHWISFSGVGKDQADERAAEGAESTIAANREKPWFIGLGFLRPHVPLVAPARFFDLYPVQSIRPIENPANDRDDIPRASEMAINTRANDIGMNHRDKQEALRGYYASISYMDSLVGRVLDRLEKAGQADRTVVVFWGDHGWHLGEHFRWQKRSLFEESARVPLIVSAPGRKGNGKPSEALVELVDVYPTVAELCRIKPPSNIDGQSFVPLLNNPQRSWKAAAFTQVAAPRGIVGDVRLRGLGPEDQRASPNGLLS